jgi:hypothetical protein
MSRHIELVQRTGHSRGRGEVASGALGQLGQPGQHGLDHEEPGATGTGSVDGMLSDS